MSTIAELAEDRTVEGVYAVARKQRLRTKKGAAYLALENLQQPLPGQRLYRRLADPGLADECRQWQFLFPRQHLHHAPPGVV